MLPALFPGEHSHLVRKGADEFIIVTARGKVLPVTNWIDAAGNDAAGQEDAAVCVCGTEAMGFYTITLLGGYHYAH